MWTHCACQLVCLCLVSWTFLRSMEDRLTILWSPPSYLQMFSPLARPQVAPPRHCVWVDREVTREALFRRLKPFRNLMRPVCNSFERLSGIRSSLEPATIGTLFPDLHTVMFPSFDNDGSSPFFHAQEYSTSAHNRPRQNAARESSNSTSVTKASTSLTCAVASSADPSILWSQWRYKSLDFLVRSFYSCGELRRCPQKVLCFYPHNLTEMRQRSLDMFCSVVGRIFHMPLTMYLFLCKSQAFLRAIPKFASKTLHNFRVARVTERTSNCWKIRALEQNVAQREMIGTASRFPVPTCCKMDLVRIADTPFRKSPFALNFSEVSSSLAVVMSNVLATATELARVFGSHAAFPILLEITRQSQLCSFFFSDDKSTQADATNHKHFLLNTRPSWKRDTSAFFFPKDLVPVGLRSQESTFLESWPENPYPLLWIHIFSQSRASLHTFLQETIDLCLFPSS